MNQGRPNELVLIRTVHTQAHLRVSLWTGPSVVEAAVRTRRLVEGAGGIQSWLHPSPAQLREGDGFAGTVYRCQRARILRQTRRRGQVVSSGPLRSNWLWGACRGEAGVTRSPGLVAQNAEDSEFQGKKGCGGVCAGGDEEAKAKMFPARAFAQPQCYK